MVPQCGKWLIIDADPSPNTHRQYINFLSWVYPQIRSISTLEIEAVSGHPPPCRVHPTWWRVVMAGHPTAAWRVIEGHARGPSNAQG